MTLVEDLLDLEVPDALDITLVGDRVVYHTRTKWDHRRGEHHTSSIWIADIRTENSARRITDGTYHDHSPRWTPDGQYIVFLSNRKRDKDVRDSTYSLYCLHIGSGGEPRLLARAFPPLSIFKFLISPRENDVVYILGSVQDVVSENSHVERVPGPLHNKLCRVTISDYGRERQDSEFAFFLSRHSRPMTIDPTCDPEDCVGIEPFDIPFDIPIGTREGHVADVAWSADGTYVVTVTQPTDDMDSARLHGSTFWVERASRILDGAARPFFRIPLDVPSLVWAGSHVYFQSWNVRGDNMSGLALYRLEVPSWALDDTLAGIVIYPPIADGDDAYTRVVGGDTNCVRGLRPLRDDVVVHLQERTHEMLLLLHANRTLLVQEQSILDFAATAAVNGEVTLAIAKGDTNHPTEVFSVVPPGKFVQLSDHGRQLAGLGFGTPDTIELPTFDGTETIDALFVEPVTKTPAAPPYPTVVLIHAGPYTRAADSFDSPDLAHLLVPVLLRAGVAVLQPNYRGGSGSGARSASSLTRRDGGGGIGRDDLSDVVALTNEAVRRGLADPVRLVAAGWSHGGYLAYLAAVRNKTHGLGWRFRGAVCASAVSDWGALLAQSGDDGDFAQQTSSGSRGSNGDANETAAGLAAASPLQEFPRAASEGRIPPLLLLHGEADACVPVSQAWRFQQALAAARLPHTLVTYPGQGHIFESRAFLEDVLARVLRFTATHLSLYLDDSIFGAGPSSRSFT